MRSRFSAFSLGLGEYLVNTLAEDHRDRALPHADLVRDLSRVRERHRFLGLTIVHTSESGSSGEVLFFARVFEKGADRSFAELSSFTREEGAWRYASGLLVPRSKLPESIEGLTRESFLALAESLA